jgi:hypothetical protein
MLSDAIIDRNVHLSALVLSTEMPVAGGQGGALPPDFGRSVKNENSPNLSLTFFSSKCFFLQKYGPIYVECHVFKVTK